jgi:hypothetical protein
MALKVAGSVKSYARVSFLRERLIIKLCGLVGLRPGEALAL